MGASFEDLDVWKRSCRLSVELYRSLRGCRDYGMKDQILRASVSIPSNIAEGSERNSKPEFMRFLNFAKGSAAELRTQIYISKEAKILTASDAQRFVGELRELSKMLQSLHDSLKVS